MSFIEVAGLEHTYLRGTPFASKVLHGVDLTIERGELVGLVGPSRSGKSTLVQYLNGLLRPEAGRVVVDGIDTARIKDLRVLHQRVGLVFQYPEDQLFADTVSEDVAFGPRNAGLEGHELRARVTGALAAVGLEPGTFWERDIHALSGGQKRRAAIAGVLALQPEVLVLDDPVAGLDPKGRDEILAWVSELHRSEGRTTVLISNNLEDIAPLLQRVLVMDEGKIVAQGEPQEVFADLELMRATKLGLLPTVELMQRLRDRGYDVPLGVLTPAHAARVIANLPDVAPRPKGASYGAR